MHVDVRSRWPVLLLTISLVSGCVDSPVESLDPDRFVPAFSGQGDCPPCEELEDSVWQRLKGHIDFLEWNEDNGIVACDSILTALKSFTKADFGKWTDSGASSGIHHPQYHDTLTYPGWHIGIAEDYLNEAYGSAVLMKTVFHEAAHHLGWSEHTARSGLNGAYGAEENGVCINW